MVSPPTPNTRPSPLLLNCTPPSPNPDPADLAAEVARLENEVAALVIASRVSSGPLVSAFDVALDHVAALEEWIDALTGTLAPHRTAARNIETLSQEAHQQRTNRELLVTELTAVLEELTLPAPDVAALKTSPFSSRDGLADILEAIDHLGCIFATLGAFADRGERWAALPFIRERHAYAQGLAHALSTRFLVYISTALTTAAEEQAGMPHRTPARAADLSGIHEVTEAFQPVLQFCAAHDSATLAQIRTAYSAAASSFLTASLASFIRAAAASITQANGIDLSTVPRIAGPVAPATSGATAGSALPPVFRAVRNSMVEEAAFLRSAFGLSADEANTIRDAEFKSPLSAFYRLADTADIDPLLGLSVLASLAALTASPKPPTAPAQLPFRSKLTHRPPALSASNLPLSTGSEPDSTSDSEPHSDLASPLLARTASLAASPPPPEVPSLLTLTLADTQGRLATKFSKFADMQTAGLSKVKLVPIRQAGLLPPFLTVPQLVSAIATLGGDVSAATAAALQLTRGLFAWLDQCVAADKRHRSKYEHITRLQNTRAFLVEMGRFPAAGTVLGTELDNRRAQQAAALSAYLAWLVTEEFPDLAEFVSAVEALLRRGTTPSDVVFMAGFSASDARRVAATVTEKAVKHATDHIRGRVEKHVDADLDLRKLIFTGLAPKTDDWLSSASRTLHAVYGKDVSLSVSSHSMSQLLVDAL
jgi:hypothetical protein